MREIKKDKHGIVLTVDGEPMMRFPKTAEGLAKAKHYKKVGWKRR